MFLTHQARCLFGVRQTEISVNNRPPDNRLLFFGKRQAGDSLGRADLPAQIAVILTIPEASDQRRGVEIIYARIETRRIEGVSRTNLDALSTPDAFFLKVLVVRDAGRPQKTPCRGVERERLRQQEARRQAADEHPAFPGEGLREGAGDGCKTKADPLVFARRST